MLEDDDTLATEATSEEDDNGSGGERGANLGRAEGLASLELLLVGVAFRSNLTICGFKLAQAALRAAQHQTAAACSLPKYPPLAALLVGWLSRTFLGTATSVAG